MKRDSFLSLLLPKWFRLGIVDGPDQNPAPASPNEGDLSNGTLAMIAAGMWDHPEFEVVLRDGSQLWPLVKPPAGLALAGS